MRVRDVLRPALPIALILSACSAAGPSPTPTPTTAPSPTVAPSPTSGNSATLLLRVTTEGGFIGPAANLAALPQVTVLADGRILTPGAVDAIYPGPLLLPVDVRDVGQIGAAAILAAIRAAGLDKAGAGAGGGGGGGGIPGDTGTTVFLANVDGSQVTTRIVLGGGLPGRPGAASPDPQAAAASDLLNRLLDPTETWGAGSVATTAFVPVGLRVYVAPGAPAGDPSLPEPTIAWPLSSPLDQFGVPAVPDRGITGLRQGVVLGADAQALLPILHRANVLSAFGSADHLYTLYVRVLLPDEVPAQG